LIVDVGIEDQTAKRRCSTEAECGTADVQKNVLLNGVDSSTENAAFSHAIFQKI
jgi:hypothetical protein